MIRNFRIFILLIATTLFFTLSCSELTKYSEIPAIEYSSHIAADTVDALNNPVRFVELKFSIIDGDGDFGLKDSDTLPPYDTIFNNNFFTSLYGLNNGNSEIVENILNPNSRIKYIEIEGQTTYKADIYIEFSYSKSLVNYDTIKYEFFVVDRALNQSNTVTTPNIVF